MYGKRDKEKGKKNVKWRKWGSSAIIQSVWSKSYGLHDFQYIYIMHDATYNVSQGMFGSRVWVWIYLPNRP